MIVVTNVLVEYLSAGYYSLYGCATSCSLDISTDMIETSVTGKGLNRTFKPTSNSFTGSMDGLINLNDPGLVTAHDLLTKQLSHTLMTARMTWKDEKENSMSVEFDFYISGSSLSGSHNSAAGFSIEMRGAGNLTISHINIDPS